MYYSPALLSVYPSIVPDGGGALFGEEWLRELISARHHMARMWPSSIGYKVALRDFERCRRLLEKAGFPSAVVLQIVHDRHATFEKYQENLVRVSCNTRTSANGLAE